MMARIENDAVLRTALVQSTALRKGIDLRDQLPAAKVEEPRETFTPMNFDPSATSEIHLNLLDEELD